MKRNKFCHWVLALLFLAISVTAICRIPRPDKPKLIYEPPTTPPVVRGRILARDGTVIARTVPCWQFRLDPRANGKATNVWNNARVADYLSKALDLDKGFLLSQLERTDNRYIKIKETLDPAYYERVKSRLRPLRLVVEKLPRRDYPLGRMAAHAVGFAYGGYAAGEPLVGATGLEAQWAKLLAMGEDVRTDLLPSAQRELYETITNAISQTKAEAGWGVVLSTDLNEILAMVSVPDFDPADYRHSSDDERLNRAAQYPFFPGDIVRLLVGTSVTNDVRQVLERLRHLGFGESRNLCHGEISGALPDPANAAPDLLPNLLAGRAMTATTLQLARALAISAQEGDPIPHYSISAPSLQIRGRILTKVLSLANNRVAVTTVLNPNIR